jgi:hypothetical protein
MATRHGYNSRLYFGTGTAIPVAETHGIQVGFETQTAEDSSQGDSFITRLTGLTDFTLEFDKWYDNAEFMLIDAVIAKTSGKYYFYPDAADATIYVYGNAKIGGGGFDAPLDGIVDQSFSLFPTDQPTFKHP